MVGCRGAGARPLVLLPNSPITIALIAVILLAAVFTGVGLVLRSKELDEKPGRNPVTPPSIDT